MTLGIIYNNFFGILIKNINEDIVLKRELIPSAPLICSRYRRIIHIQCRFHVVFWHRTNNFQTQFLIFRIDPQSYNAHCIPEITDRLLWRVD